MSTDDCLNQSLLQALATCFCVEDIQRGGKRAHDVQPRTCCCHVDVDAATPGHSGHTQLIVGVISGVIVNNDTSHPFIIQQCRL